MKVAGARSAVAKEAEDDPVGALHRLGQPCAGGHRDVAADDAGRAQVALLHIGDVHGPPPPEAIAGLTAAQLGHHLVIVLLLGFLGLGDGRPPRVAVTVAAVGAGDQVVVSKHRDRANSDCFLTGVKV